MEKQEKLASGPYGSGQERNLLSGVVGAPSQVFPFLSFPSPPLLSLFLFLIVLFQLRKMKNNSCGIFIRHYVRVRKGRGLGGKRVWDALALWCIQALRGEGRDLKQDTHTKQKPSRPTVKVWARWGPTHWHEDSAKLETPPHIFRYFLPSPSPVCLSASLSGLSQNLSGLAHVRRLYFWIVRFLPIAAPLRMCLWCQSIASHFTALTPLTDSPTSPQSWPPPCKGCWSRGI